ncbi:helix-turn-helix domain-containing protein [Clostridium tagluense]|uniref:hypothetical protein n=1 Tax=Clostridium tagluense TaxID=360422 RepID=UPI001CF1E3E4|nr:hypothetical protein [Clostridium tagluense]MCB2297062.1 hypothetical protein [Clostridium tagluense]
MSQDEVRIELKNFLLDKGVKNKKVAESVGLSDNTISMFLREKRELSHRKLELIHQYVMKNT